jgi:inorganic phosphate transporter, PiT family
MHLLRFLAACFLSYSNGANDNIKGVASLLGSGAASYRTAVGWATITTFAGSVCSILFAQALLKAFSGRGLVPDRIVGSQVFVPAVALGAGLTVIAATRLGFPVSTTHALLGAMVGVGLMVSGAQINLHALSGGFVLPLLLSPFLAGILAASLYLSFRFARISLGITKEWCICVGQVEHLVAIPQPVSAMSLQAEVLPVLDSHAGNTADCRARYAGRLMGVEIRKLMDALHFLSAGVVSFSRGLNDTPKIAALLLAVQVLDMRIGIGTLATAMTIGGLLSAARVANTMSVRITTINHGQGFAANLATGILVILASLFGLPVSTTHVSVGALAGIGLGMRQTNPGVLRGIALSWLLTLPCAAFFCRSDLAGHGEDLKWPI